MFLVADDDEKIRNLLVGFLQKIVEEAHEIHTAESGEKAIELAKQISFDKLLPEIPQLI